MSFYETDEMLQWVCDKCRLSAEFPPGEFWAGWRELKSRGWCATLEEEGFGRSWSHRCAKCAKRQAEEDWKSLDEPMGLRKVKG